MIAARLPRGAGVIYRHFGAHDRLSQARALAKICRRRGLIFLVSADPALARAVQAEGLHWPERVMPARRAGFRIETGAAHSPRALRKAEAAKMDAALLSPVFATRSAGAGEPLGARKSGQWARKCGIPVFALGGVSRESVREVTKRGFAGFAAIDGFSEN